MTPCVLVLMGVSGSGKTTVGTQLSKRLGWAFKEGDELHPAGNIAKMRAGEPLTDADRKPWLAAVAAWIDAWLSGGVHGVITCSALKQAYRYFLTNDRPQVAFVFLETSKSVLVERLAKRRGHFMAQSLLETQLATLETPSASEPVIVVNSDHPLAGQIDAIMQAITTPVRQSINLGCI